MKNPIIPRKPTLFSDLHCGIKLKKNQVDIVRIKNQAAREGYREQISRHITIIGLKRGQEICDILNRLAYNEKFDKIRKIKKLLKSFNWQFTDKEIYHISRKNLAYNEFEQEDRESYIRLIHQPSMSKFYSKLNRLLNTNFNAPPPHITLFTLGEKPGSAYRGIGIDSKEKFKTLNPKKIKF